MCVCVYIDYQPSYEDPLAAEDNMPNFGELSFGVIPLAIVITFVFLSICKRWYKNREMPVVKWEDKEYYLSEIIENDKDCQTDIDDAFTLHNHPMLPGWLKEHKDMIFLQSNIEKGQMIGRGQFGVVFKGKINLGNAVYVFMFLITSKII